MHKFLLSLNCTAALSGVFVRLYCTSLENALYSAQGKHPLNNLAASFLDSRSSGLEVVGNVSIVCFWYCLTVARSCCWAALN